MKECIKNFSLLPLFASSFYRKLLLLSPIPPLPKEPTPNNLFGPVAPPAPGVGFRTWDVNRLNPVSKFSEEPLLPTAAPGA